MPGPPAPRPGPPPAHLLIGSPRSAGSTAVSKAEQAQARPHTDRAPATVAISASCCSLQLPRLRWSHRRRSQPRRLTVTRCSSSPPRTSN
eukprot:5678861-Alexandrium_andersonii.AAC.1